MPCSSPSGKLVRKPLGPQFPWALLAKQTGQEQAPLLSFASEESHPPRPMGRSCQLRRGRLRPQEGQTSQGLSRIFSNIVR